MKDNYLDLFIKTHSNLEKFQEEVENLLKAYAKLELIEAEQNNAKSVIHRYAVGVCEDLLAELQRMKTKYQIGGTK